MNILLVDNGSSYTPQLRAILAPSRVITIPFQSLTKHSFDDYDLIVLSGGHKYAVMSHRREYARELNLIATSTKPIIGICLGFELIVTAFGGTLKLLRQKVHGDIEITFSGNDPINMGRSTLEVFESHRRGVKHLPPTLIPLAHSANGVEIIRHIDRPIYAFQFHPEMSKASSWGAIIKNAIHQLVT